MTTQEDKTKKTKWQQLLEAPKGCLEYNPQQAFALQVFWLVRSLKAAQEMIEKGLRPCSVATQRNTPTTLAYLFRISHDQKLAKDFTKQVRLIGQHPHYLPAFKSIKMGIPKMNMELKLKQGGIDVSPLDWNEEEPIDGHEDELDFHPVVLECTEIYLDNRSFYEHGSSQDWMKHYPEIVKPSRSLKPTTYCVGNPSQEIWEKALENSLKAIRFTQDDERIYVKEIQPGLYLNRTPTNLENFLGVFFMEIDLTIRNENLTKCHPVCSEIQKELDAPFMIIIPTNLNDDVEERKDVIEVRLMVSIPYKNEMNHCKSLSLLINQECENYKGRIIVFDNNGHDNLIESVQEFLESSGLNSEKITILESKTAEQNNELAGYALHPQYYKTIVNEQLDYKL